MTIPSSAWSAPWTADDRCTRHQSALAEKDLADWLDGKPHVSFDAFRKLLDPIEFEDLLEIGCGCGHYREVLKSFKPHVEYMGIDISEDMIDYADKHFEGNGHFIVGSADKLPFVDEHFDVVCPSAVIQHMPDYRPAIREAIRVSRHYVLLHRIEATSQNTFEIINTAYETELPTRIINEQELLAFCGLHGLTLRQQEKWGVGPTRWNGSYLLEKA